jgi:hypothetical protein
MTNNLPIYDVVAGDMNCISLVERPAIQRDFLLFSQAQELRFAMDEDKHIAFGPAMIADMPILRNAPDGSQYYIVFSAEAIRKLVQSFMSNDKRTFSEEHDGKPLEGITIVESFFKSDDLSPKGFESVANGSWFVSLHIDNDKVWQDLRDGTRRGFSIECRVDTVERPQALQMSETDWVDAVINNL